MAKWIMVFIMVLVSIAVLNSSLALIMAPNILFNVIGVTGIVALIILWVKLFEKGKDKLR